jgi:hypothetical protein
MPEGKDFLRGAAVGLLVRDDESRAGFSTPCPKNRHTRPILSVGSVTSRNDARLVHSGAEQLASDAGCKSKARCLGQKQSLHVRTSRLFS